MKIFSPPRERIAWSRSIPIACQFPRHMLIPHISLPPISMARRWPSRSWNSLGTPPMLATGGSSGCTAILTPASSHTGTILRAKYS